MKKKLYIGCALSNLPPDKREAVLEIVDKVKKTLREKFTVLEFKGVADISGPNPLSARDIYDFDIGECVKKADYMLAICDYPALGLGYEIAVAVEKQNIPVLAMAYKDSTVTRLIRGIDNKNFQFCFYDSVDEITKKALEFFLSQNDKK